MHFHKILLPIDFSEASHSITKRFVDSPFFCEAREVHFLHILDFTGIYMSYGSSVAVPADFESQMVLAARKKMDAFVADLGISPERIKTHVVQGEVAHQIVQFSEKHNMNLVLMPTHGRKGMARFFLGSVTERVLRSSPCPVLTVRWHEQV